jgi:hypothetical protein
LQARNALNRPFSLSACEASQAFSRDRLERRFPAAENLSVYDGQTLLGFVLACARLLPSYAFGADQQVIVAFDPPKAAVEATHGAAQRIEGSR